MSAPESRRQALADLGNESFDILVIGGGATGCGIAVDAATRGLKVALVERNDFAEGTSGRSTKLLHGGVRYLEAAVRSLDRTHFKLVRQALKERGAVLANAPHLTQKLPLVTPLYKWREVPYVYAGLKLYDFLSGKLSIGRSRLLGRKEALARFPALKSEGLKAGVLYYDGQFVDSRLVIALVRTARSHGATLVNQVAAARLLHDEAGKVAGAECLDRLDGGRFEIRAKVVINAAGPFADGVCRLDDPAAKPILTVSSGIHIVLDCRFVPPETGLLIPKTDDGRVLFILPWENHALVGTTDEAAEIDDHPRPAPEDIAYLLDHVRRHFGVKVEESDILASWSGIRPLAFDPKAKKPAELARDHVLIEAPSGLLTITGGKWTTYRLMSEETVDRAGFAHAGPCRTATLRLFGGHGYDPQAYRALMEDFGLDEDIARHLNRSHGDQARKVLAEGGETRLDPGHPFIEAEVSYAVRQEDALHAVDVLARRMSLALTDRAAARRAAPRVIALMAAELGWGEAEIGAEMAFVEERLEGGL